MEMKVYAIKHKDERIREASRSGGFFTALSDWFLNHKGVVYGCVLTEKYEAKHIRCIDKNVRNLMRGSKYIQSSMGNCFELVKKDLDECKNVLFTGTSCQIDGLKHYLQREYDNLFCLDIVCHGVPSKKVWIEYLKWLSKDDLGSISSVDFRNKVDFGWHTHVETITFKDGSKINSEVFQRLFYGHAVLRPSCYVCPYKNVFHPGDITIADFWGIDKCKPEFDDNKGVSLVLVNTEKGLMYWDKIKDDLQVEESNIDDAMQRPLIAPFPKPKNRERFWADFRSKKFSYIARKYGGYGRVNAMKRLIKKNIKKIIRKN
jgi:coenzyme F420-reducing hydrogenase beta subunit